MLKSLHIGRYTNNPEDFRKLVDFFEAIGFEALESDAGDARGTILTAPLAMLSLNPLPPDYPKEVAARLKDVAKLIVLEVTNPDDVYAIAGRMHIKIVADSLSNHGDRSFSLELPGDVIVTVHGRPEPPVVATEGKLDGSGKRFAVVVSRFNAFITERLLAGALDALRRTGAIDIEVIRVPGAFEVPSAARTLAETRKYDAIICIGCLLRGDTAHYDVIVNEVTRGIGQSAQETGVPHAFGVLTCDTLEQAIDRAGLKMGNKGFEAALAAVEMANLKKAVSKKGKSSAPRSKNSKARTPSSRRKPRA